MRLTLQDVAVAFIHNEGCIPDGPPQQTASITNAHNATFLGNKLHINNRYRSILLLVEQLMEKPKWSAIMGLVSCCHMFISGCTASDSSFVRQWPTVLPLIDETSVFEIGDKKKEVAERAVFAMAYEIGEYVRFQDGEGVVELVFDTVNDDGDDLSLQQEFDVRDSIEGWYFNRGKKISWGKSNHIFVGEDQITTQLYRLSSGYSCIGLLQEWDHPPGDNQGNPSKVVFGYMCEKQTEPLSDQQTAELLVAADSQRFETYRPFLPDASRGKVDKKIMRLASGRGGFGHVDFPFDYGFPFRGGDGEDYGN